MSSWSEAQYTIDEVTNDVKNGVSSIKNDIGTGIELFRPNTLHSVHTVFNKTPKSMGTGVVNIVEVSGKGTIHEFIYGSYDISEAAQVSVTLTVDDEVMYISNSAYRQYIGIIKASNIITYGNNSAYAMCLSSIRGNFIPVSGTPYFYLSDLQSKEYAMPSQLLPSSGGRVIIVPNSIPFNKNIKVDIQYAGYTPELESQTVYSTTNLVYSS